VPHGVNARGALQKAIAEVLDLIEDVVSPEGIEFLEGNSANLLMARRFWF
jgi:hypothetical protein